MQEEWGKVWSFRLAKPPSTVRRAQWATSLGLENYQKVETNATVEASLKRSQRRARTLSGTLLEVTHGKGPACILPVSWEVE